MKKVKEIRSKNWYVQNRHGEVKYNGRNMANNIVITMYGARWVLEILGGTHCKVYNSLNTMLYT